MSAPTKPTPASPEPERKMTRAETKAEIERLAKKLEAEDRKRYGGAGPRTPKARMLDATALEEKNPDKHYCYVNVEDPGNLQSHMDEGYRAVSQETAEKAGVRQKVGEVVLMEIPREVFEERVERQKEIAHSRLDAHRAEYKEAVQGVAKELRDRGYSPEVIRRILVDE